MRSVVLALAISATLCLARPVTAQTMRCDGNVVSVGDLKLELLDRCGEPALTETGTKEREVKVFDPDKKVLRSVRTTVVVEAWTYNFGPGRFLYVVRLEGGRIVSIESAGFGH